MPAPILVDNLIDQVRDQTDEFSEINVTDQDILQALNRGQVYGVNIMARHYEDPFVQYQELELTSGTIAYDLPEDLFEDRLLRVEIVTNTTTYPVRRIPYRDIHLYENGGSTSVPSVYTMFGRTIHFYGTPDGSYNARLWYMREPETLVKSQGRISYINYASGQFTVDSIGDDLSSSVTNLSCFFNVVDAQTGEVKGTYQAATVTSNQITIKAANPNRTTIYNKPVETVIGTSIEVDDYICLTSGTCVPFMKHPMSNFLIQFAVAEIRRRLTDNADMETRVLRDFEKLIERQWAGREVQQRVAKRSAQWARRRLKYFSRG